MKANTVGGISKEADTKEKGAAATGPIGHHTV
jgi:hypothetical protein